MRRFSHGQMERGSIAHNCTLLHTFLICVKIIAYRPQSFSWGGDGEMSQSAAKCSMLDSERVTRQQTGSCGGAPRGCGIQQGDVVLLRNYVRPGFIAPVSLPLMFA